jgi:penicillin-binding protein 1A
MAMNMPDPNQPDLESPITKTPKLKIPNLKIKIKKFKRGTVLRAILILMLAGLAAGLGGIFGSFYAIKDDLPDVGDIDTFRPKLITTVYAADGQPVKEFAEERRVEVSYAEIPKILVDAIVATEDPSFFRHGGVDLRGILRAVWADVFKVLGGRRPEGGSTITQQLARSLFLHREVSLRRKLKELFLSREIEKRYSKEQILELYCNHFFLGHGVWGVQSAAHLFFGKDVGDLSLEEAALIAGIFRGPSIYSPYTNKERTLDRRNHVLNRLVSEGYLTKAEGEEAKQRPMNVLPLRRTRRSAGISRKTTASKACTGTGSRSTRRSTRRSSATPNGPSTRGSATPRTASPDGAPTSPTCSGPTPMSLRASWPAPRPNSKANGS